MAGLAVSIFLRRAGLQVICLEREVFPRVRVGESLDWSAPGMLRLLGLPPERLIEQAAATYKRNIKIVHAEGTPFYGAPKGWFRNSPLKFEVTTLHVDRDVFDQSLFKLARDVGVEFEWERVTDIELDHDRVHSCRTAAGRRFAASWFIDASGRARVLPRALHIESDEYGPRKVCLWTYYKAPVANEGTTFYADHNDHYLKWIWEIPVSPERLSVGCIMAADQFRRLCPSGAEVSKVLFEELAKHARFRGLLHEQPNPEVLRCSYRSYVSRRVCGPNWFVAGESASLPDPLTANGVTAAFRHARDAAELIVHADTRRSLTPRERATYTRSVRMMGEAFNHSIETSIYDWPVRWGLGVLAAEKVYTAFSYPVNALYSKFHPRTRVSVALFGVLVGGVRAWMNSWALVGRAAFKLRSAAARQRSVGLPVSRGKGSTGG